MKEIKLSRNNLKVYLIIGFSSIFYFGLGLFFTSHAFININQIGTSLSNILEIAFSCLLYFLGYYTIKCYLSNSMDVEIDKEKIIFNADVYHWEDALSISLRRKQPFKYIFNFPMEGIKIRFKNGDIKYIFDDLYYKTWQAKYLIQELVIDKKEDFEFEIASYNNTIPKYQDFRDYKGSLLKSVYGISLWAMPIFFIFLITSNADSLHTKVSVMISIIGFLYFIGNSYFLHYFSISDNYLMIRNHVFFWKHRVYKIADVKEIVFESESRWPNCLRVITKDYRSKLYPADTLSDKTWIEIKRVMKNQGVIVRNECIYNDQDFEI